MPEIYENDFFAFLKRSGEDVEKSLKNLAHLSDKIRPSKYLSTTEPSVSQTSAAIKYLEDKGFNSENPIDWEDHDFIAAWKSNLYEFAQTANQLQRFSYARRIAISDLIRGVKFSIDSSNPILFMTSLRSSYEYICHGIHLIKDLEEYLEKNKNLQISDISNISEIIHKFTLQTRADWRSLSEGDYKKYKKNENEIDVSSKSIFNSIDIISESYPKTRSSYEFLCEFVHPNTGSYFLYNQSSVDIFPNSKGFMFIERIIGEYGNFQGISDVGKSLLIESINNLNIIAKDYENYIDKVKIIKNKIRILARKYIKNAVSKNPVVWDRFEYCPCGSGQSIGKCCVPKLRPKNLYH